MYSCSGPTQAGDERYGGAVPTTGTGAASAQRREDGGGHGSQVSPPMQSHRPSALSVCPVLSWRSTGRRGH